MTILDEWEITAEELTEPLDENPSLRGMLLGYVADLGYLSNYNVMAILYLQPR